MKISLCAVAFLVASVAVQAAPAKPPVAVPIPTEKDGLRVSVGSIELRTSDPHINVVLQNTSSKPIAVPDEGDLRGWRNLRMEISKVDGRVLAKPIVVERNWVVWSAIALTGETIGPGEAIVREVRFTVPVPSNGGTELGFYTGFPMLSQGRMHHLTMRAIFASDESIKKGWTGAVASRWKEYSLSWLPN